MWRFFSFFDFIIENLGLPSHLEWGCLRNKNISTVLEFVDFLLPNMKFGKQTRRISGLLLEDDVERGCAKGKVKGFSIKVGYAISNRSWALKGKSLRLGGKKNSDFLIFKISRCVQFAHAHTNAFAWHKLNNETINYIFLMLPKFILCLNLPPPLKPKHSSHIDSIQMIFYIFFSSTFFHPIIKASFKSNIQMQQHEQGLWEDVSRGESWT